ncbi:MAG: hypothetical protein DRQ40_02015 [Gammaproteobacteria bacterium]|nr:MAG: hypothetical protein DRQ40_02015 [Gammaproteobacteria bacterium]
MFKEWCSKLAWMFVSFKVWAFSIIISLLVLAWLSAEKGFYTSIEVAKQLHDKEYINSEQLSNIVTHSQTIYMDSLMGHVSIFGSAVLVAIIALKAATEWQSISKDKEVIKKAHSSEFENGGLKKFMSKAGQ